jgi:hypothetical protein
MRLDHFPSRITGFFDRLDPPRSISPNSFKRACYAAAQWEGVSVEGIDLDLLSKNFYAATIRTSVDDVSVLCNSVHPYLAFVPARSFEVGTDLALIFIEPVRLAATFLAATEFQPLDACWLNADVNNDLLAGLAASELSNARYWKPGRIGDVIFNFWD